MAVIVLLSVVITRIVDNSLQNMRNYYFFVVFEIDLAKK
jgi:hypothetical protein